MFGRKKTHPVKGNGKFTCREDLVPDEYGYLMDLLSGYGFHAVLNVREISVSFEGEYDSDGISELLEQLRIYLDSGFISFCAEDLSGWRFFFDKGRTCWTCDGGRMRFVSGEDAALIQKCLRLCIEHGLLDPGEKEAALKIENM